MYSRKVLVLLFVIAAHCFACRERPRAEVEEIIARSNTLSRMDVACTGFPKPESFELERKNLGGNSVKSSINYQYHAHMPFESVKVFYQNEELRRTFGFHSEKYLENWSNTINFRHNEVIISIHNRPPSWFVNVGCSNVE